MYSKKLTRQFYHQKTLKVAKELLGKFLIHKVGKKKLAGMITETEAYCGPKDKASHASRGRTARTAIMFGEAGHAYIYLIYGMYYCFNIVTEQKNYPAAVLIRGVKAKEAINGPGKVCRYLKIDKKLNGTDLTGSRLWVEDRGVKIKKSAIHSGQRIGVDYAREYKNKRWRFYI